jgi:hypothetical protein
MEFFVSEVYFLVFYPSLLLPVTSGIWGLLEVLRKFYFESRVVSLEAVIESD